MIITRAPLRISFLGGGSDHPVWFRQHGGAVISASINKYVYLQMRHLPSIFKFNFRIVWRIIEQVSEIGDIDHPVIREVLRHYFPGAPKRFEIAYNADLPSRSGLGSSSAFTVALLQGLWAQQGQLISQVELAREAMHVEQDLLKEPVGCQDQVAVAYGGLNRIDFMKDNTFRVTPLPLPAGKIDDLQSHMMLFFTHFDHEAGVIESSKLKNFDKKEKNLHRIQSMVDEGQRLLLDPTETISRFGTLMHEGWKLKRDLSNLVSNSDIDDAYQAAIMAGASGGKLLGAGGGGFLLFIVPPEKRQKVREALRNLVEVPVRFEYRGSHIVLYDPELDSVKVDNKTAHHLECKIKQI